MLMLIFGLVLFGMVLFGLARVLESAGRRRRRIDKLYRTRRER